MSPGVPASPALAATATAAASVTAGARTSVLPRIDTAPAVAQPARPIHPEPAPAADPEPAPAADPPRHPHWHHQRTKKWYVALAATVGVLALLGSCGTFAYQLVQDELAGRQAQADAPPEPPAPEPRDISSREVDPEPLTVEELFPADEVVINPAEPPYQVLRTQESDDCTVAAADDLGDLLSDAGCEQVVRATLQSPTEAYLVTGGIFNLATEEDAEQVYNGVGPMIDDESGRFLGLLADDGTEPIVLSETRVGWDFRGHFLIYVVIARVDGEPFGEADDRHAELILWDIVELHLRTNVLDGRAVVLPEDPPAAEGAEAGEPEDPPTAAEDPAE